MNTTARQVRMVNGPSMILSSAARLAPQNAAPTVTPVQGRSAAHLLRFETFRALAPANPDPFARAEGVGLRRARRSADRLAPVSGRGRGREVPRCRRTSREGIATAAHVDVAGRANAWHGGEGTDDQAVGIAKFY